MDKKEWLRQLLLANVTIERAQPNAFQPGTPARCTLENPRRPGT